MKSDRRAQLRALDRWAAAHMTLRRAAHAVASPLNVVLGFATMLAEDDAVPPASQAHAAKVADQARKIRRLLDEAIEETLPSPHDHVVGDVALGGLLQEARKLAEGEASVDVPADLPLVRADETVALAALTAWMPYVAPGRAITAEAMQVDDPADRHARAGRYVMVTATLDAGAAPTAAVLGATLRGLMRAGGGFATLEGGGDEGELTVKTAFATT